MLRRIFALVTLLLAIPVLASAWTLTLKVTGPAGVAGNNLAVSGGAAKTLTGGTSTLYPTSAATISVNTAAGYTSAVKVDGFASASSTVSFSTGSHTVEVLYASAGPSTNDVTISQAPAGGGISLQLPNSTSTMTGATGVALGTVLPVTIASAPGYTITGYTLNGTAFAHSGAPGEVLTVPSFVVSATPVPNTVSATFSLVASITATLSAPLSGITGQALPFSASATSNDSGLQYRFAVTSTPAGSAVSLTPQGPGTSQTFSFVPDLAGSYTVQLDVTSAGGGSVSKTATVGVVAAIANSVSQCTSCHSNSTPQVVADYNSSLHLNRISCVDCHTPTPHAALPSSTVCVGCHADSSGNVPLHPFVIGVNPCLTCHNPHTVVGINGSTVMPPAHYNNMTGAAYPASYVSSRANCDDCHYYKDPNAAIRKQWAASGHGAVSAPPWTAYDFKTRSGCVQCHTRTGFVAFSSARVTTAWGVASDKTKEVLACAGCHSDLSTAALRRVVPARPFAGDSYQNREVGNSNLCMDCHSGTNNGKSIQAKVGVADFSNLPFIAPHYLTAGGTLQGVSGYHFPGRVYSNYSANSHREIGMASAAGVTPAGPCVSCHMSGAETHNLKPVTTDASGTVITLTATVCVNCHAGSLDASGLDADRVMYQNALTVLKAQLAAKGFVSTPGYPYFSSTSWGSGQAGANAMGAAFNYVLLVSEPGAYAHNSLYAKQLVMDSIDYLDNAQFDNSVATLAVPSLLASGAISQAVADSFVAYRAKQNNCTSCHGFTAPSGNPMASGGHPAHLTAAYGPGGYLGSDVSACQACHGVGSTSHRNGVVDLVAGGCLGCHAGATPTWSPGRLSCTDCHAAVPALLPNGVVAPFKANFASTGHGQFAASSQCTVCHDPGSNHISGSLGSYTRLRLLNDNNLCASCHNGPTVGAAFRNMSSHVTKDGRTLGCRDCHDPHGSANLSMIRQTINGVTIVFTDNVNGLVDPAGNRGLCQVCHTLTSHYQAGVPETGHFTSGCLNCHSHNSAGGAFRPVGGSCDSCHGYPPVPRNAGISFGTTNNWANARYEDYSGGGGAHVATPHISPFAVASEGWANCTVCHNGGQSGSTPNHRMTTPVQSHIDNVTVLVDPELRFADGFIAYTGAKRVSQPARNQTGSCFNISCHMSQSPRWSTER